MKSLDNYVKNILTCLERSNFETAKEYSKKAIALSNNNAKLYLLLLMSIFRFRNYDEFINTPTIIDCPLYDKVIKYKDEEVAKLINKRNSNFCFVDGLLYSANKKTLYSVSKYVRFCKILNGVTNISKYAFYKCYNLEKVIIPNSVSIIGEYAFYKCTNLLSIRIPNGVKRINNCTFSFCYNLKNVILPKKLTYIGDNAFALCKSLKTIKIPTTVTHIGQDAFDNGIKLT